MGTQKGFRKVPYLKLASGISDSNKKRETYDHKKIMDMYKSGSREEANALMCESLKGLIRQIIRKKGVPECFTEDACQEGNLAVILQMEKYDPERAGAVRYFTPYIENRITEFVCSQVYGTTRYGARRAKRLKELKDQARIDKKVVSFTGMKEALGYKDKSACRKFLETSRKEMTVSLEELLEHTEFKNEDDPESFVISKMEKEMLHTALSRLGSRSRDIIGKRYGFYDGIPYSIVELALEYKMSSMAMRREIEKILLFLKFFMQAEPDETGTAAGRRRGTMLTFRNSLEISVDDQNIDSHVKYRKLG